MDEKKTLRDFIEILEKEISDVRSAPFLAATGAGLLDNIAALGLVRVLDARAYTVLGLLVSNIVLEVLKKAESGNGW